MTPTVLARSLLMTALLAAGSAAAADDPARVNRILAATPLIDGHNDLPWEIRTRFHGDVSTFDFASDTGRMPAPPNEAQLMTDLPRLHAGHVGGQFWSVWIPVETKGAEAVQMTIEQIDLVKSLIARYPNDLAMAYSAADIRRL
ncbi:MAG TPA: membrane dipeptidase, partial [Rudaea sp.]